MSQQVFDWLDFDKDQKISFLDLKKTIGFELMPQEQFFFRQDVLSSLHRLSNGRDLVGRGRRVAFNSRSRGLESDKRSPAGAATVSWRICPRLRH